MSVIKSGVPVSPGIAMGKVYKLRTKTIIPSTKKIPQNRIYEEIQRLRESIRRAQGQLETLISMQKDGERADILTVHHAILDDPDFIAKILRYIQEDYENAEKALVLTMDEISRQFEQMNDEYLRERILDYRDVVNRVLHIMHGIELAHVTKLDEQVLIVARDLSPSQAASMDLDKVLGFVTDFGGRTSHTAIMARNMEIPAVVGCRDLFDKVSDADRIIVDGISGNICVRPSEKDIAFYLEKSEVFEKESERLNKMREAEPRTLDGYRIQFGVNAGNMHEIQASMERGADGIGLLRTEFLYMEKSDFPSEEQQYLFYKEAVETLKGRKLVLRTLDVGGDKELPYLYIDDEPNPCLGYRSIRICLDRPEIFKTQLRAVLRASVYGSVHIMYPMITTISELKRANATLEECRNELRQEGIPFSDRIPVGMMVETPATVIMIERFLKYVDFVSIGTNDLTMYTLAADRNNERVCDLHSPFYPAILLSIQRVVREVHKQGKMVNVCGAITDDPRAVPLLIGLGLDGISSSLGASLRIKEVLTHVRYEDCYNLAKHVVQLETHDEVIQVLETFLNRVFSQ